MHRKANNKSNTRKEERCCSSSILVNHPCYTLALGIVATLGISALLPSPYANAISNSALNITVGNPTSSYATSGGYPVLRPSANESKFASFTVPVDIDVYGSEDYTITLRSSSEEEATATNPNNYTWSEDYYNAGNYNISTTGNLVGSKDGNTSTIVPISTTTYPDGISEDNLKSSSTSTWGYRWNYTTLTDDKIPARDATTSERQATRNGLVQNLTNTDLYYGIKPSGEPTRLANTATITNPTLNGAYTTNSNKNASGRLLLEFAANVTSDLPADTYTGYVAVSVVATPHKITLLSSELVYMQDMDPEICYDTPTPKGPNDGTMAKNTITNRYATYNSSVATDYTLSTSDKYYVGTTADDISGNISYAETPETTYANMLTAYNANTANYRSDLVPETTLIDKRDNKAYLVRKLADGNCWMSQNLELDFLTASGGYVAHDEAGKSYDPDTQQYMGVVASKMGSTATGIKDIKFTPADTDVTADWTPLSISIPTYATILSTVTTNDPEYGWATYGDDGLRSYSYTASDPNWTYSDQNGGSSATGATVNRRGNLYSWTTATLGSVVDAGAAIDATQSICPKGWQLPLDDKTPDDVNTTNKSFSNLLRKNYQVVDGTGAIALEAIQKSPLNFVRSGYYGFANGGVIDRTTAGGWWTNSGYVHRASSLGTNTGLVYVEYIWSRGMGYSVRCVAK